jgi:hypothetical protein
VFQNYDPYYLLPVADYCVTLGKTTLATEALSFGRPLFSFPGTDRLPDYYAELGISQSLAESFEPLYRTIKEGVPETIDKNVRNFLHHFFYRNNSVAVQRTIEVMDYILATKHGSMKNNPVTPVSQNSKKAFHKGRISYIIPVDEDSEALLATLTSLSQNVRYPDWEVVIATNNTSIKDTISAVSGDLTVVESRGKDLPLLYNEGAAASTGEYLIFIKPGVVYFKDEGLLESMGHGIAGIPLKTPDMTPYCLGIRFDFNHVPRMIDDGTREGSHDAVGGGIIGMHRKIYEAAGGFDERIADCFIETDICLEAKERGYPVAYLPECLGIIYKETSVHDDPQGLHSPVENISMATSNGDDPEEWKKRIAFFAKWCGKLPKDDDYIRFAGELLKV